MCLHLRDIRTAPNREYLAPSWKPGLVSKAPVYYKARYNGTTEREVKADRIFPDFLAGPQSAAFGTIMSS